MYARKNPHPHLTKLTDYLFIHQPSQTIFGENKTLKLRLFCIYKQPNFTSKNEADKKFGCELSFG
jgi:hypothetical protein